VPPFLQRQFVDEMEAGQAPYPTEPKYVFDKVCTAGMRCVARVVMISRRCRSPGPSDTAQGEFLNKGRAGGQTALARQIEEALPSWTARGRRLGLFLTLGGDESGVQFHRHNDGWNTLIAGRKRWFLYPPRVLPVPAFPAEDLPIRKFGVYDPCCTSCIRRLQLDLGSSYQRVNLMQTDNALVYVIAFNMFISVPGDWLSDFYPGLMTLPEGSPARPMECIQQEGELLYVPEGWYHATVNLGDTVRHVEGLTLQL
jgi:hypothetical protein